MRVIFRESLALCLAASVMFCAAIVIGQCYGCGSSAIDKGRHTLEALAVLTDGVDHAVEFAIDAQCAQFAGDAPAVEMCLADHDLDDAINGVAAADRSLLAGQAALDAAEELDREDSFVIAAIACISKSVIEGILAVQAVGVTIPSELAGALSLAYTLSVNCHPAPRGTEEGRLP